MQCNSKGNAILIRDICPLLGPGASEHRGTVEEPQQQAKCSNSAAFCAFKHENADFTQNSAQTTYFELHLLF